MSLMNFQAKGASLPTPVVKLSAIDLNLLVVFDAVMQERNVTRSGQRLGLSQPAMSHALTRLRHMLRSLHPKPEGHVANVAGRTAGITDQSGSSWIAAFAGTHTDC